MCMLFKFRITEILVFPKKNGNKETVYFMY